jgi:hypothetical protein
MLIKKIGGNWHRVETWNDFIIGYKSGGIVMKGLGGLGVRQIKCINR